MPAIQPADAEALKSGCSKVKSMSVTKEARAAFDYTCRHYLKMGGGEFLRKLDAGEFDTKNPSTGLKRVLAMLPFAR